jgi:hypothetical protein
LAPVVPPTPSRQSTNRARLAKLSLRLPSFYLRLGPTFTRGRPNSALSRAGCPEQPLHAAAKISFYGVHSLIEAPKFCVALCGRNGAMD